jgi:periplasmic divalent cation tolerance protein
MDDAVIVLTSLPDREAAMRLAHDLVSRKLAACVNVLAECTSVYRWKNAVEDAREVPVLIKTRASRYAEIEAAIRGLHPYELPEIIAVPVVRGFEDYLRWIADETSISIG